MMPRDARVSRTGLLSPVLRVLRSALLLVALGIPGAVHAQMVVSGRVTVANQAVDGATVAIPSLEIEARTTTDGRYNLLVRAAQVRGQIVTVTARHRRFGSQSVALRLTGGSAEQNFAIGEQPIVTAPPPPRRDSVVGTVPAGAPRRVDVKRVAAQRRVVDSTALQELAGPLDLGSALAGRIPGLVVTSASALGGSAPMFVRGSRSISGSVHPLVVLDGVPVDRLGFGTAAQQVGFGGFDYGTSLQDIALDDIATVTLLDPANAVLRFGSRAANGVLEIRTKQAGSAGLQYSVRQRFSMESPTRLPSYQNRFGQGLGGQFEFFDGMGGGINDGADQSWGPALDGQPIPQASLTEPRRADVRHWLPRADGVKGYLESGRTYDLNATLSRASALNGFRLGINARDAAGVTPTTSARRLGVALGAFTQPTPRFSARGNMLFSSNRAEDRPGTGYDEINPVAGFTRFGRQVDLAALRTAVRENEEQINWIYTGRNNPWVQTIANSNTDERTHVLAGVQLAYDLTSWLRASLHGGLGEIHESRELSVASGWRGGFPTALGRGDFSGGGTQSQRLTGSEHTADLSLSTTSLRALGFEIGTVAGIESRGSNFSARTNLADIVSGGGTPPFAPATEERGTGSVTSLHLSAIAARANYLQLNAGARIEQSSDFRKDLSSAVFPAAGLSYDLAPVVATLEGRLAAARLRASWWRSGNELSRRTLSQAFVGASTPVRMLTVPLGAGMLPERTTGIEFGAEVASLGRRFGIDLTYYDERSSELLLALGAAGPNVLTEQSGEISNKGVELDLRLVPYRGAPGTAWELRASLARNTNKVEKLADGVDEIPLSPSIWGSSLVAREGSPAGVISGRRYLRNATGALVLRNGLPIADQAGPLSVLGSWRPDWTASLQSTVQFRGIELALLLDARRGGKIFSATNMWGSYAGTLESTVADRETGVVVAGVDSLTGASNTTTVEVEDYFHALGAIHEAWVYDASYTKLRDARLSYETSLRSVPGFSGQTLRVSLIGRNLFTWAKAPNIDPETALSAGAFQGFEMGQLPNTRSVGLQLTITP